MTGLLLGLRDDEEALATPPSVTQAFVPLTVHVSPVFVASVVIAVASDPAWGSVR